MVSAIALACGSGTAQASSVLVDIVVQARPGGVFRYAFTIQNQGPLDVAIVSLSDAPIADPIIDGSLAWPAGFFASYDSGLGFLDFLEDTTPFMPGLPVSGFSLDSGSPPFTAFLSFESIDVNGGIMTGTATMRVIDGDGTGVIPEPGRAPLGLASLLACLLVRRRGRCHSQHPR